MLRHTKWPLVLRHLIPAVYVPTATLIGFGILVAVTGAGRFENVEEIGFMLAGSSLVFVFARLARRDPASATQNVRTFASLC